MNAPIDYLSDPESVPKRDIPEALAKLEGLKAKLLCRLVEPGDAATRPEVPDRLITVDEAAETLSFTKQFVYEMVRKGQLPSVRQGKYVRLRLADLSRWMDDHTERMLDKRIYHSYSTPHERKRTAGNKKAARPHSRADGGKDRCAVEHGGEMGARRVADFRTHLKTDPADSPEGKPGATPDERIS